MFSDDDQEVTCRWLAKEDAANPFVVDGYDCLSFVSSRVTATSDPRIAETFVLLRDTLGTENFGLLPPRPIEVPAKLEYPRQGAVLDGPLFKAQEMEQKWDIYLYSDRIYFCRSWTGELIYVAEFAIAPSRLIVTRVWLSGETETDSADFAIRDVDYLIKSHLFGHHVPHPLPKELPRDAEEVAHYSFSRYGNVCCFGTFEDTLGSDLGKPPS